MSAVTVPAEDAVTFTYTNWRGETAVRRIRAKGATFRFGSTEWHPEPQWLLSAIDLDKMEGRDFALKDIVFAARSPVTVPAGEPTAANIVKAIASRMSELREARRMSLQDVADSAGLTKSHIWELEQGRTSNPTVATVCAISRAFGVSINYLTGLSPDQPALHPEALRIACEIDRLMRRETRHD